MTNFFLRTALAILSSSVCTAGLLTALSARTIWLPVVLLGLAWFFFQVFRSLDLLAQRYSLTAPEWALLGYVVVLGLLRLVPYGNQYFTHHLVGEVAWADNWHFQELASVVNSERFPPHLNFQPDSILHFYYIPWMPAAAVSIVTKLLTGNAIIKFAFAFDAVFLNITAVLVVLLFLRHALSDQARNKALVGLLIAGAACDGFFGLLHLIQTGSIEHSEWWQLRYLIRNQFTALTTSVELVPHHLISAAGMLLAIILVTEPQTLLPRRQSSILAYGAAGLLLAFSLFASAFVFIGGAIALAPIAARLTRRPWKPVVAIVVATAISAPLAYLYLRPTATGGFIFGEPFTAWQTHFHGSVLGGLAGTSAAIIFMLAEVGWLYVVALPRFGRWVESPLSQMALAAFLYLVSTAFLGYSGGNNYATRGTIVPIVVLSCFWGRAMAEHTATMWTRIMALKYGRPLLLGTASVVVIFAVIGHLNEFVRLANQSWQSFSFPLESEACKDRIERLNELGGDPEQVLAVGCRYNLSAYHIERNFVKADLSVPDLELMEKRP